MSHSSHPQRHNRRVQINFYGERDLVIQTDRYARGGGLFVELIAADEPFATLSVNLPTESLGETEFAFKTYSENEGLLEELERVGAVERTGRVVGGILNLPVCRLVSPEQPLSP